MLSFCPYYITIKLRGKWFEFNSRMPHKLEVAQFFNIDLIHQNRGVFSSFNPGQVTFLCTHWNDDPAVSIFGFIHLYAVAVHITGQGLHNITIMINIAIPLYRD